MGSIIEFYARYIWPIHRRFVKLNKRCKKCITSEKQVELYNGICPQCLVNEVKFDEDKIKSGQELETYLHSCKKVVVLLSGGKDSAYLLNRLKNNYNINLIALTITHDNANETAVENARLACKTLDIEHIIIRLPWSLIKKTYRDIILKGGNACNVDFAHGDMIHNKGSQFAKDIGADAVISGVSYIQVVDVIKCRGYKNDNILYPFYIWTYNEAIMREQVERLKLIKRGKSSPLVSNDQLLLGMVMVDEWRLGYCSFESQFSSMIRRGEAKRKTWLPIVEMFEFVGKFGWPLDRSATEMLKKLDLTKQDII